jgi:hypothetical protein
MVTLLDERFKNGLELIKKLDKKRWEIQKEPEYPEYFLPRSNFTAEERILIHWITYITDRILNTTIIWTDLHRIFSFWVKEYLKDMTVDKLFDKNKGFIGVNGECKKSRFSYDDFKHIKRTLEILKNYNKSLVKFILEQLIQLGEEDKNIVRKIACALFLLSYDSLDEKETFEILRNKEKFNTYYLDWEKSSRRGKKRLWAAFRDYIRVGSDWRQDFLDALKKLNADEKYIKLWDKLGKEFHYLNQLELPGDIWNAEPEFINEFLIPLANAIGISSKNKTKITPNNVSEFVRNVCDKLQKEYGEEIFPEQFDFVWGGELLKEFLAEFKGKPLNKFIKT